MEKERKFLYGLAGTLVAIFIVWLFVAPAHNEGKITYQNTDPSIDASIETTSEPSSVKDLEKQVNARVSKTLTDIAHSRQTDHLLLDEAIHVHGPNSTEAVQAYTRSAENEEQYCKLVTQIIDRYGWLGPERIGAQNNFTLFTTIQRAGFEVQEKYLAVLEAAVNSGSLSPVLFAQMVDRRALVQHRMQIYGTQLQKDKISGKTVLAPLINSANLNERRKQIGLPPYPFSDEGNGISYRVDNEKLI